MWCAYYMGVACAGRDEEDGRRFVMDASRGVFYLWDEAMDAVEAAWKEEGAGVFDKVKMGLQQ